MIEKIDRYYLEITSIDKLKDKQKPIDNLKIDLLRPENFELNKFFYKQIGKDHFWRDRLVWTDKQWLKYSSNPLLETWILKDNENNLIGYYEIEKHENKEFEEFTSAILA